MTIPRDGKRLRQLGGQGSSVFIENYLKNAETFSDIKVLFYFSVTNTSLASPWTLQLSLNFSQKQCVHVSLENSKYYLWNTGKHSSSTCGSGKQEFRDARCPDSCRNPGGELGLPQVEELTWLKANSIWVSKEQGDPSWQYWWLYWLTIATTYWAPQSYAINLDCVFMSFVYRYLQISYYFDDIISHFVFLLSALY